MWMLIRENAIPMDDDGTRLLAASPDTPDRGDAWRWSVRSVTNAAGDRRIILDIDEQVVRGHATTHSDGECLDLERSPGTQIVLTLTEGQALVTDREGPSRRWLGAGDVFVVEGEQAESLRFALTPGQGVAQVIRLEPTGDAPLRWVP